MTGSETRTWTSTDFVRTLFDFDFAPQEALN